jgi:L-ascorbate metabolism protein UlaG (beta-lactamase superfamily)
MRVTYLGHACFLLADEKFSVIFDPFTDIGYELDFPHADFCICSHSHFDHSATNKVVVNEIITKQNALNYPRIKLINSFHDEVNGQKRGDNLIIVVEIGGIKVCHMGDLGEPLNMDLINKIGKIDLLLIPVGGKYTIDADEAFKYASLLAPKAIIPMHYKTSRSQIDIASKDKFLSFFDKIEKVEKQFDFSVPNNLTVYDLNDSEF